MNLEYIITWIVSDVHHPRQTLRQLTSLTAQITESFRWISLPTGLMSPPPRHPTPGEVIQLKMLYPLVKAFKIITSHSHIY